MQLVDTVLTLLSSVQRKQQTTLSTACGNVSGRDRAQVTDCLGHEMSFQKDYIV